MTRTRVSAEDLIQAATHFVGECPDAAFLVARDGIIVAWNTRAAELFGIPAWEASARNCAKVVRGRSADGTPLCSTHCPLLSGLAEPVPGPVPICVAYGSRGSGRSVNVQHVPIKNPLRGTTIAMVHLVDFVP